MCVQWQKERWWIPISKVLMILVGKTMKSLWKKVGEGMDFENGSSEPSSPNVAQKRKKHLQEKGEWGVGRVGGSIAFDSNEYAHLKKSKEEKEWRKHLFRTFSTHHLLTKLALIAKGILKFAWDWCLQDKGVKTVESRTKHRSWVELYKWVLQSLDVCEFLKKGPSWALQVHNFCIVISWW